jgi:EAL domain-containing protein (putative c-di-GMP-specific phosphodiesterase class I)
VTGLHADTIKRDVVEMLVNLARRIDAICVAEGIETPEDLELCRALGIPYGQGFYLGVPAETPAVGPARAFSENRLKFGGTGP